MVRHSKRATTRKGVNNVTVQQESLKHQNSCEERYDNKETRRVHTQSEKQKTSRSGGTWAGNYGAKTRAVYHHASCGVACMVSHERMPLFNLWKERSVNEFSAGPGQRTAKEAFLRITEPAPSKIPAAYLITNGHPDPLGPPMAPQRRTLQPHQRCKRL